MDIKEISKFACSNLKNHKKYTIKNILIISLSTIVLLMTSVFTNVIGKTMEDALKHEDYYLFYTCYLENNMYEKLKGDQRFQEVGYGNIIPYYGYCTNVEEVLGDEYKGMNITYEISRLYGLYEKYSEYDGELGLYEILVPRYICVSQEELPGYFSKGKYIDGNELIGKKITLDILNSDKYEYTEQGVYQLPAGKYEFNIVGTFDNAGLQEGGFQLYASAETLVNMECNMTGKNESSSIYAVLKDLKYREQIIEENNLEAYAFSSGENEEVLYIMDAVNVLGKIIFVMGIVSVIVILLKETKQRMSEFAIMKAIGYEQSVINKIYGFEILYLFLIALVIAVIFSIVAFVILEILKNMVMGIVIAKAFSFAIRMKDIFIAGMLIFLTVIVSYGIAVEKMTKSNLLSALKGKE